MSLVKNFPSSIQMNADNYIVPRSSLGLPHLRQALFVDRYNSVFLSVLKFNTDDNTECATHSVFVSELIIKTEIKTEKQPLLSYFLSVDLQN